MNIEEKLNLIGFTDFVHLRREKRDENQRKFFTAKYNEEWFSILLVKIKNEWEIEHCDGSFFTDEKLTINQLIDFFKYQYYIDTDISHLL